jgi:hypothetical protein
MYQVRQALKREKWLPVPSNTALMRKRCRQIQRVATTCLSCAEAREVVANSGKSQCKDYSALKRKNGRQILLLANQSLSCADAKSLVASSSQPNTRDCVFKSIKIIMSTYKQNRLFLSLLKWC